MTDTVHVCTEWWFDRTICPEPCGTMHYYCTECGAQDHPCAVTGWSGG